MAERFTSRRTAGILAAVVILAFAGLLAMIGFGEDLAPRDRPGATPYSRSATGYQGLVRLLEASGRDVRVTRRMQTAQSYRSDLLVLTPEAFGRNSLLEDVRPPLLVILPKWLSRSDEFSRWKERDMRLTDYGVLDDILDALDVDADMVRTENRTVNWRGDARKVKVEEALQLVDGDDLVPLISNADGALFARVQGKDIWIVSDPDILANHGIDDATNARLALEMLAAASEDGPLIFDATLNGFEVGSNPVKTLLTPPMLGVTLLSIGAVALLFWAAFSTFGPRRREVRDLQLGTMTLVESTAGLFSMTSREGLLANDYLRLTRERLRRALGLPRAMPDGAMTALLDRMAAEKGLNRRFSDFEETLSKPVSRRKLMAEARALHDWTEAIIP